MEWGLKLNATGCVDTYTVHYFVVYLEYKVHYIVQSCVQGILPSTTLRAESWNDRVLNFAQFLVV